MQSYLQQEFFRELHQTKSFFPKAGEPPFAAFGSDVRCADKADCQNDSETVKNAATPSVRFSTSNSLYALKLA